MRKKTADSGAIKSAVSESLVGPSLKFYMKNEKLEIYFKQSGM